MTQIDLFTDFAKEYDLNLSQDFMNKISAFCEILLEANKLTNLVSKNDEQKLLTRHVADSLIFAKFSILNYQPAAVHQLGANFKVSQFSIQFSTWADIGSGAGFPVIPLCIYMPHVQFYAIEPRKKRCEFLNSVKQKLNLQNIEIIQGRVVGAIPRDCPNNANHCDKNAIGIKLPEPVDIVSCRAVGSLEEDFARAKKILKKGGAFLTVKSKRIIDENPPPKTAKIHPYKLPNEEMDYALIFMLNND